MRKEDFYLLFDLKKNKTDIWIKREDTIHSKGTWFKSRIIRISDGKNGLRISYLTEDAKKGVSTSEWEHICERISLTEQIVGPPIKIENKPKQINLFECQEKDGFEKFYLFMVNTGRRGWRLSTQYLNDKGLDTNGNRVFKNWHSMDRVRTDLFINIKESL